MSHKINRDNEYLPLTGGTVSGPVYTTGNTELSIGVFDNTDNGNNNHRNTFISSANNTYVDLTDSTIISSNNNYYNGSNLNFLTTIGCDGCTFSSSSLISRRVYIGFNDEDLDASISQSGVVHTNNLINTGFRCENVGNVSGSTTLSRDNYIITAAPSILTGNITTTLPSGPIDGQILTFRRLTSSGQNWTISPNVGHTLNVAGTTGNYNIPSDDNLTIFYRQSNSTWYNI